MPGSAGCTGRTWGEDGAVGAGSLRVLDLPADVCGRRQRPRPRARSRSQGVKTCGERRYFERGEVAISAANTPPGGQPATYLRAPC